MGRDCVINGMLLNTISSLLLILLTVNVSTSQVIGPFDQDEIATESREENEEILQKLTSKISIKEFLSDATIYLNFITEIQRNDLNEHINNTGNMVDLLELQSISTFTLHDFRRLLTIIKMESADYSDTQQKYQFASRHIFQSEQDKNHLGGHWAGYQQLKITLSNSLKMGYSREQDIGEINNGIIADHQSIYITKQWKQVELNVGRYQVYQGFGLLVGQGYSTSFGAGGINNLVQHSLRGNANQTETNIMSGLYLISRRKKFSYTVAYSTQHIDEGTPTGYHRTLSEINKKDKKLEEIVLMGFEQNGRLFRSKYLGVIDVQNNTMGISIGLQNYFRNTIEFIELAHYNSTTAYTMGILLLIARDVQLNLSHTHFENKYKTPWQSYTIQGFSEHDGDGFAINLGVPFRKKWVLNYTYKMNTKTVLEEANYGQNSGFYHSIKLDKNLTRNTKLKNIVLLQKNSTESSTIRVRSQLSTIYNEQLQYEYLFYLNTNKYQYSKALTISLKYKINYLKCTYSLAFLQISQSLPIYLTIDNIIQSRQTIGVYATGIIQTAGIHFKLNRNIQSGMFIQYRSKGINHSSSYKLMFSFKYL